MITIGAKAYTGNAKAFNGVGKIQEYRLTDDAKELVGRIQAKLVFRNVSGGNLLAAVKELRDWICLPARASERMGAFDAYEVFEKLFRDENELADTLVAHCMAGPQRRKEEELAFAVLEDFSYFEANIDPVMTSMIAAAIENNVDTSRWKYYYGPASELDFSRGWQGLLASLNRLTDMDRLYKKVAFFHDFARNAKLSVQNSDEKRRYNEKRAEHDGMRFSNAKHSLDEQNAVVQQDRLDGQSIWAGTSGSAMDMINIAMQYGMTADAQITSFAWAIFAFFHFMPTVKSPTHTFIEVMRGAEKMVGNGRLVGVQTNSAVRPAVHFHDMDLS